MCIPCALFNPLFHLYEKCYFPSCTLDTVCVSKNVEVQKPLLIYMITNTNLLYSLTTNLSVFLFFAL